MNKTKIAFNQYVIASVDCILKIDSFAVAIAVNGKFRTCAPATVLNRPMS